MSSPLREGTGVALVALSLATLFYAIVQLRGHDYVAGVLLVLTALSLLRAGVELVRVTAGE